MENRERMPTPQISPDSLSPEEVSLLRESTKTTIAFANREDGLYLKDEGLNPKDIGPFASKKELFAFCGFDLDKGEKPEFQMEH